MVVRNQLVIFVANKINIGYAITNFYNKSLKIYLSSSIVNDECYLIITNFLNSNRVAHTVVNN